MAAERVIVVGTGGIFGAWIGPIKAEGLEIVGMVDLRQEVAEKKIAEHGLAEVRAWNHIDPALRDLRGKADFVINLTSPEAHCEITCKALAAGLPVLGEKPMAMSMAEARQMVAASEKAGKIFMVGQSRRWEPGHEALRRTAAGDGIGKVTGLNCDFYIGAHFGGFRDEMESPLILDMAIHHFDLARMFCGQNAVSVYAEEFNPEGSWYKGDAGADCLFEMTGGVRFAYRGSWCAEGCHTSWNGDWRMIGTKGTMLCAGDKMPTGEVVAGEEGFFRPKGPLAVAAVEMPQTAWHGELRAMLAYLRGGAVPQTECHDNIHSLAMVFAAMASARAGRRVKISEL